MFSQKFRLPSTIKFPREPVFASPLFFLKRRKNTLGYNRYGFIISKKTSSLATQRNKTKRVFRAVIESFHPALQSGNDLLFVLKNNMEGKPTEELVIEVKKALRKIGLL